MPEPGRSCKLGRRTLPRIDHLTPPHSETGVLLTGRTHPHSLFPQVASCSLRSHPVPSAHLEPEATASNSDFPHFRGHLSAPFSNEGSFYHGTSAGAPTFALLHEWPCPRPEARPALRKWGHLSMTPILWLPVEDATRTPLTHLTENQAERIREFERLVA